MRPSFLLFVSVLSLSVLAQAPPAGGAPAGGGATPTSPGGATNPGNTGIGGIGNTSPGRTTMPGQNPNDPSRFPDMQRNQPIFLSGKVMMEDGTPPPDSVTIERVCNGVIRPEGYTNSKGHFSIELGRNNAVMADASTSNGIDDGIFGRSGGSLGGRNTGLGGLGNTRGISERDLMGCEIRANLGGFRSESINLAGRRALDNSDIGTIILRRIANVEGYTFSMTTALAPKEAKRSYDKGLDLLKKKKTSEAMAEIEKATAAYPKYAIAWYDLGRAYEMEKRSADARKAFESSIAADSKYVKPYVNLAFLHAQSKEWAKTAEISAKGIKLNPFEYPLLHYVNAVSNLNLGKIDDAEKSAREASKLDPKGQLPRIDQLLGVILAQKNDIKGAKESFSNYLKKDPNSPEAEQVKLQLARLDAAPAPAVRPAPAQPAPAPAPAPESATNEAAPPPAAPAPSVGQRTAWPSWSNGISDLPPGTLSKALDYSSLRKEIGNSVYSLVTAGDASQLKPEASEFHGAAVAVSGNLLVTNCDVLENSGSTGLYQDGKLITSTVRLIKARRSNGLCVLEAGGARLRPVNGVRYAQDLNAGEKTFTLHSGALGEGTLQAAKLQGNIKLLVSNSPVTASTAGGGLFDSFGNLIGVTTLRSQTAVIAVEEFYQ
ncbi:MAG: tetratricopeptide repeat protein [Acidobacteria bacterium]|nr:tetratricopeptide repeat protein [Acidobacteriota bacterium]